MSTYGPFLEGFFRISKYSIKMLGTRAGYNWRHHHWVLFWSLITVLWTCFDFDHWHKYGVNSILSWFGDGQIFVSHRYWASLAIILSFHLGWIFCVGTREFLRRARITNAFRATGVKNEAGEIPKIYQVAPGLPSQEVLIAANGVAPSDIMGKARKLESALHAKLYEAKFSHQKKRIKLTFSTVDLPKRIDFKTVSDQLKEPYSFVVGQSQKGLIFDTLDNHSHFLACGTTGGGKSNFTNTLLLSLLSSPKPVDLQLIDLKGGVEFHCFHGLPGVRVATTLSDAVEMLKRVSTEMDARYAEMKRLGLRKFNDEKIDKNRMFLVIDEASELFMISKTSKEKRDLARKAREVTEHLAKTARASGIHILFSTQKPTKESLDTSIRTNIGTVMAFRLPDVATSTVAIGNRAATDLPNIAGRGLWKEGNEMVEVQTLYLRDSELDRALEKLKSNTPKEVNVTDKKNDNATPKAVSHSSRKEEPI